MRPSGKLPDTRRSEMKKLFAFLLLAALVLSLAACGSSNTASGSAADTAAAGTVSKTPIRIAGLKGPTSMGMVKLMEDASAGTAAGEYTFSLHGSADEVTPKLVQGELDMAAIPANLAAVLYNNTGGAVRVMAVNTLGVLYIVEKGETVTDIASLKGKTVYATGKGSTPEYTLRFLLEQNGLDPDKDVTLEFKSEPTEVVSLLASASEGVAMLPQPYVTVAQTKVEGLRTAIDLTKAWDSLGLDSQLITGVLVGRTDFIEKNPEAVAGFLNEYKASVDWVLANSDSAAELMEKFDIVKAAVAKKAIPGCNLTFLAGPDMVKPLSGYLETLFGQNPKAVGGKLPDDAFYYTGE